MKPLVLPYRDRTPSIAETAFVAPGAAVIGGVEIGERASVWFGCVLRGDVNFIHVGAGTNLQDGTVVHVSRRTHPTVIGQNVVVGHQATIHACLLEDGCFVGMRAIVMDGAVVEKGAMVAAGALVAPGKRVLSGELWAGMPAKKLRELTDEERAYMKESAEHYARLAQEYRLRL